jgi:hypothetical protein
MDAFVPIKIEDFGMTPEEREKTANAMKLLGRRVSLTQMADLLATDEEPTEEEKPYGSR